MRDQDAGEEAREDDGTDRGVVDLALLDQGLGRKDLLDFPGETEDSRYETEELHGVSRAAGLVQATTLGREDGCIVEPVLERAAGEMWGHFLNQQVVEILVLSLAEDLPEVGIGQGVVASDLQLEQVVLRGVQVDGVDAGRRAQGVGEDVVAGGGDGKHDVGRAQVEDAGVDTGVFPCEGVDVLVIELCVLLVLIIEVNAEMVVLVEEGGQREVGGQVEDGGGVGFGADFWVSLLYGFGERGGIVGRVQVGRFGDGGVDTLDDVVARGRGRGVLLWAAEPHVVGDGTEEVVATISGEDGAEAVLEVVSAAGFEADAVDIKPGAPEETAKPVDVARQSAASVIPRGQVDDGLYIKVNHTDDASGSKQIGKGVDDGEEIGLKSQSSFSI